MKDIKTYTRVTEALSEFSGLKKIPEEILKNAAIRGQKVHDITDAIMADIGMLDIDEEIVGYIDSFNQWLPKNFLEKPERWYCDKYTITGEADGMYAEGEDLVLFDTKTPAKESSTWVLQLSAYAYLARKAGYPVTAIEVVMLNKDGKPPKVIRYKENFELFLKCLDVYRYFYKETENENYLDYI